MKRITALIFVLLFTLLCSCEMIGTDNSTEPKPAPLSSTIKQYTKHRRGD